LAGDYLHKGKARRSARQGLFEEESYDDVVREAQAIVELILKGTLRFIGVDPPKRHDMPPVSLVQHAQMEGEYYELPNGLQFPVGMQYFKTPFPAVRGTPR